MDQIGDGLSLGQIKRPFIKAFGKFTPSAIRTLLRADKTSKTRFLHNDAVQHQFNGIFASIAVRSCKIEGDPRPKACRRVFVILQNGHNVVWV